MELGTILWTVHGRELVFVFQLREMHWVVAKAKVFVNPLELWKLTNFLKPFAQVNKRVLPNFLRKNELIHFDQTTSQHQIDNGWVVSEQKFVFLQNIIFKKLKVFEKNILGLRDIALKLLRSAA